MTIEEQIAIILSDIRQKGFSSVPPFSIGKVEERMMQFTKDNDIVLGSDEIYIIATQYAGFKECQGTGSV